MHAFISYQTQEKLVAAQVKNILSAASITSFMAHEDINVSEEWRLKILDEIRRADLFVSLWSENYYKSFWCVQESGIASFRDDMTLIPLSTDGSIPQGFASNIQSTRVDPENLQLADLLPGIAKADRSMAIRLIFKKIEGSKSYRGAEANFGYLLPYVDGLTEDEGKEVLEIALANNQVLHAGLCASEYIPPIAVKYGHLLLENDRKKLSSALERYA